MTRATTRARYSGPEAGKTKSRSLTTVRQQQATGFGMTDIARRALIGNEVHSPASASPLSTVTSIFLIGNEFHLQRADFGRIFRTRGKALSSPSRRTLRDAKTAPRCKAERQGRGPTLRSSGQARVGPHKKSARNCTSLLRHAMLSNPLTPFRTSVPIVAGMAPPARMAEACLRYRRCPRSWLRTTTATFRRWCRSSSKRKAFVWSR